MKIGVVIRSWEKADGGGEPSYTELREMILVAEESGFDSIWLHDHLLFRQDEEITRGMWECWTLLSALAEATSRVELGALVLCNPFRNPALLAKMAHTLDEVSGERLILGVGAGWHQPEFDAFGFPFDRRVDRLEEALQILKPLLRGESVDFEGLYYQVRDCVITPRGPRAQGIPLLVGGEGPRVLRLAARYADQLHVPWEYRPQEWPDWLARIRSACADVDRDPASLAVTVGLPVSFPDLGEIRSRSRWHSLTGSPEQIAAVFRTYEDAGIDHVTCYGQTDSLPGIRRLAESLRLYRESN